MRPSVKPAGCCSRLSCGDGLIDPAWSEWLGGLTITHEPTGQSVLVGALADQTALYRVLLALTDLAVPLVSLTRGKESPCASNQPIDTD